MAEPLDLADLERLAALERAATRAEWSHGPEGATAPVGGVVVRAIWRQHGSWGQEQADANLALVCALRNAAPSLLRLARAGLAAERIAAIDPALLDRLAQRYGRSPGVDPRCPVCGEPMEADDGANPRPYREWWWRCATHRDRATVMPPFPRPDEDVLSLVAAIRGEGATDGK